ncbi:MAG: hypothetical protein C4540_00550 [Candidatus Omnitrophota bacterium]|jgi:hypothetical protein|nr:MAG: hypothetical protein C4540_00550 [Candidatus Omnitrophota bacterium]
MKKIMFALLCSIVPVAVSAAPKWNTVKSTHFIIYYAKAEDAFVRSVVDYAEKYYEKIADSLGFRRYNFWLWDNRAKIYIHENALEYQKETGQPSWSLGSASPKEKIIHTFLREEGFLDSILPHELGHIIFREFVGFDNPAIPLWFEEGVASYQEASKLAIAKEVVRQALKDGSFLNIEGLVRFDGKNIKDEKVVNVFYAESISIVNYLIKKFGNDRFVLFCQYLRDKKNFERALASSYPIANIKELERGWIEDIKK